MSGHDQLRQHIAKYGEHAPEPVLWDAWEALPALLAELDEAGETADYWRKRADELGTELDELRSAVRSLFTHGGQMVSAAPGTYRNLWSLVANNTDTCRGPDGQATRTETNQ